MKFSDYFVFSDTPERLKNLALMISFYVFLRLWSSISEIIYTKMKLMCCNF